jgi:hypothetical protein
MRRSARLAGRPVGSGSGSSTSTSISTSTSSVSSSSSIPGIAQTTAYSYNSRDVWIIIGARSLRQVGVGLVGVILSLQLQELRLDLRQLGTVLTASLTGATAFLLALPVLLSGAAGLPFVVAKGELLVGFTLVSAACALALPHCRSFLEVLVVVFVGSLGLPPSVAVQVPLEHSILAACVSQPPPGTTAASSDQQQQLAAPPPDLLPRVFGRYNAAATVAVSIGSIAAGLPLSLRQQWLLVAAVLAGAAGLYSCLSPAATGAATTSADITASPGGKAMGKTSGGGGAGSMFVLPRRVLLFAGLQGVDSFAGSMILQVRSSCLFIFLSPRQLVFVGCRTHELLSVSLLAYDRPTIQSLVSHFLHTQYGIDESTLGAVFGVFFLLSAGSVLLAPLVAKRIGLINTMAFTHLPTNVMICALPFCGSPAAALALWVGRACLCSMDVPARESFMMSVLGSSPTAPEEEEEEEEEGGGDQQQAAAARQSQLRVRTSSATTTVRSLAAILGPKVATELAARFSPAAPFVVAGAIKIAYDIALLSAFAGGGGEAEAKANRQRQQRNVRSEGSVKI